MDENTRYYFINPDDMLNYEDSRAKINNASILTELCFINGFFTVLKNDINYIEELKNTIPFIDEGIPVNDLEKTRKVVGHINELSSSEKLCLYCPSNDFFAKIKDENTLKQYNGFVQNAKKCESYIFNTSFVNTPLKPNSDSKKVFIKSNEAFNTPKWWNFYVNAYSPNNKIKLKNFEEKENLQIPALPNQYGGTTIAGKKIIHRICLDALYVNPFPGTVHVDYFIVQSNIITPLLVFSNWGKIEGKRVIDYESSIGKYSQFFPEIITLTLLDRDSTTDLSLYKTLKNFFYSIKNSKTTFIFADPQTDIPKTKVEPIHSQSSVVGRVYRGINNDDPKKITLQAQFEIPEATPYKDEKFTKYNNLIEYSIWDL
jgi:hypothetical protein